MNEAVLFIFFDGQHILLEYRKSERGEFENILMPGGGIESFDKKEHGDYREHAMHREIQEEFKGSVVATEYHYAGVVTHSVTNTAFHVYIVTSWTGTHPEYSNVDDEDHALLQWMKHEKAEAVVTNEIAKGAIAKIRTFIKHSFTNHQQ